MSFISSWIKVIFIIVLAFPLYSETSLKPPPRELPDCDAFKDRLHVCTGEMDPVCASNGRTYHNGCIFCTVLLDILSPFDFSHYGRC